MYLTLFCSRYRGFHTRSNQLDYLFSTKCADPVHTVMSGKYVKPVG